MLPGVFPVPLTIAGETEWWPFDRYRSGPIEVQVLHGGENGVPEPLPVTIVNHLPGWEATASDERTGFSAREQSYRCGMRFTAHRARRWMG